MKLPKFIEKELALCQYRWEVKSSKRHQKIFIEEKLVGVLSLGVNKDQHGTSDRRAGMNLRSQIRRRIRELDILFASSRSSSSSGYNHTEGGSR